MWRFTVGLYRDQPAAEEMREALKKMEDADGDEIELLTRHAMKLRYYRRLEILL